jgi:hypothetical protein
MIHFVIPALHEDHICMTKVTKQGILQRRMRPRHETANTAWRQGDTKRSPQADPREGSGKI